MLIKKITFKDFRQFKGKQVLEFSCDKENNVTILLGDNTFGKTTILQAFNWCLYGVADFPKDSNPKFLLNLETADEMAGLQQKCEVIVELIIEHKNTEYIIMRKQPYVDRAYGNWNALNDQLVVSYKENGITKQVREGEERTVINSILPQSLSGYFFFDTERVSDIGSRKDLSEAVKGLLGLAAVGNARKHLGSRTLKTTAIGYWNDHLNSEGDLMAQTALDTIDTETKNIEKYEQEIKDAQNEIANLNANKDKISEILRENKHTSELQNQKQDFERRMDQEKKELDNCNELFLSYYNNLASTYFMIPLIEQAEKFMENANIDDRGIRDMTESSIRDIIKRGRCICGQPIVVEKDGESGNEAYLNILEELKYLPPVHIGTAINNFKELLNNDIRNISQFYPTIEQKYKEIQSHRDNVAVLEDKINKINESIFGKENMSSYEADLNKIKADIRRMSEKVEKRNREIGASQSAIDSAQKQYDGLVSTTGRNEKLIRYIAYAEKICNWIDETYAEKEQDTRLMLQDHVNNIFNRMYHGERKVQIDKHYQVTLFTKINGKDVVTGESEGLKRVKNFAFIAGLVELAKEKAVLGKSASDSISWENEAYPLVMDAPFSNADETHIKNISSVLPKVANQVIMFVMEKDWQYAKPVIEDKVGKYCILNKITETHTEIDK